MTDIIVFISGEGTNLQAIIDAQQELGVSIRTVFCNKENAGGLSRAKKHDIPTKLAVWDRQTESRAEYDERLAACVLKNKETFGTDLQFIVLAGWMHILSQEFLDAVGVPVINLHPALPGTFKGANAIGMAWEAYQRGEITETGVMVHRVVPEIDSGAVLAADMVPILPDDTLETLRTRVRSIEKSTLLQGIQAMTTELNLLHSGKVRQVYDCGHSILQLVASNRCSAFDRHVCDIPHKGFYLNKMSELWFQKTSGLVPNHYLGASGDSMFVQKCDPFKIEVVVRGYITGSTKTSLWTVYNAAQLGATDEFTGMNYCGNFFPAGLRKNQKLLQNVVTPTTKGVTDVPITPEEIVEQGLATAEEWEYMKLAALELFSYGQYIADGMGLILVDTKYEFGKNSQGEILLIDELHTCDSSRYWLKDGYSLDAEPQKLDKDAVREWVQQKCDPYTVEKLPTPPPEIIDRVAAVYRQMCEILAGRQIQPLYSEDPAFSRHLYLSNRNSDMAVIIAGSQSDANWVNKLRGALEGVGVYSHYYYASAHKEPEKVLEILDTYNVGQRIVYITCAGMSNALSGFVAANTPFPVIANPVYTDKVDMMVNIHSTIQMPSRVPSMTVLSIGNVALAAARILQL